MTSPDTALYLSQQALQVPQEVSLIAFFHEPGALLIPKRYINVLVQAFKQCRYNTFVMCTGILLTFFASFHHESFHKDLGE